MPKGELGGPARLADFITERYRIYERRKIERPFPWTQDPILQKYRFCNVFREHDLQTRLIHGGWLKPALKRGISDERRQHLWFAAVVARLVNWWPSLLPMGYPVPWRPEVFKRVLLERKEAGEKVFTGAYMVRADAVVDGAKSTYLADYVLTPMWEARDYLRPAPGDTLGTFHARLITMRDMGSFMAGQVVADAKHFDAELKLATDWWEWATPGPGSLRGLNRVIGRPHDTPWPEGSWQREFDNLLRILRPTLYVRNIPKIDAQNVQNCLCEFDKYERVRLGQGRPRSM